MELNTGGQYLNLKFQTKFFEYKAKISKIECRGGGRYDLMLIKRNLIKQC